MSCFFFAFKEVYFTLSLEEEDKLPRYFYSYSSLGKCSICTSPFPFSIKNHTTKIFFFLLYTLTQFEMELIITWFK